MDGEELEELQEEQQEEPQREWKGETDFYVVLLFKKMRGVRIMQLEDANGDVDRCLVIPMMKNGIKDFGKSASRMILAARKSHKDENASHILIPQVEDITQRAMVARGYFGMYEYTAPVVGDVVPDITKIPNPPMFSENSLSYEMMMEHKTENPADEAVDMTTIVQSPKKERKFLTDAQKRMREMLLRRQKGDAND